MDAKRLSPCFELKISDHSKDGQFVGYASTFNGPVDSFGDIIAQGAFSKSLEKHRQARSTPAMLWSHNPAAPIGAWKELTEDAHGLQVAGKLTLETPRGAEAYALIKDGALALSIGFQVIDQDQDRDSGVRTLREIDLWEVSIVSMPANPAAQITGVKERPVDVREFETKLRDELGFSNRQAKRLAAAGWSGLAERDVRDEDVEELIRDIKARTDEFNTLLRGR